MNSLKTMTDTIPFIKQISTTTKLQSEYMIIALCVTVLFIIKKTIFGGILSCLLALYIPLRESILAVNIPNPKINELRKLVVVFIVFAMFTVLECFGINSIVPLFSILKIATLYWVSSSEDHTNLFVELVLKKIPQEWLHFGDRIEPAVKAAAKTVDVRKDSIGIKRE